MVDEFGFGGYFGCCIMLFFDCDCVIDLWFVVGFEKGKGKDGGDDIS